MKISTTYENFRNSLKKSSITQSEQTSSYRDKYMAINKSGTPRKLFFYSIDSLKLDELRKKYSLIISALQKVTNHIVFDDNSFLQTIKKIGIDVEALKKRNPETLLSYGRIDTIFSNDTFKMLEFNCRRPQMFEDADWFSLYLRDRITQFEIKPEQSTKAITNVILNHFKLNTKKQYPEGVVVLANILKKDANFSLYNEIEKSFSNSKLLWCKPKDLNEMNEKLVLNDSGLYYEDTKIELFIVQNLRSFYKKDGSIAPDKIREAFSAQQIEIFTSPASLITGSKLLLDLVSDPELWKKINLTPDEIDSLYLIPESINLDRGFDLKTLNKNEYVIKKIGLGSGNGVKLGIDMSQEEWEKRIKGLLENKSPFILQKLINFHKEKILLENGEEIEAYLTLEPILINDSTSFNGIAFTGFSCRAIPVNIFKAGMKFNPSYNREELLFGAVVEVVSLK